MGEKLERGERGDKMAAAFADVAAYLGGAWRATQVARLVPRAVRDWAYDLFARYRYRVFGSYESCPVPTVDQRARFLD